MLEVILSTLAALVVAVVAIRLGECWHRRRARRRAHEYARAEIIRLYQYDPGPFDPRAGRGEP
jgi:hypothetical protein